VNYKFAVTENAVNILKDADIIFDLSKNDLRTKFSRLYSWAFLEKNFVRIIMSKCWFQLLNWYSMNRCQKHSILPEQTCFMVWSKNREGSSCWRVRFSIGRVQTGRSFVEDNAESLRSFNIFRQQGCTRSSRYKVCLIGKHRGSRCMWLE